MILIDEKKQMACLSWKPVAVLSIGLMLQLLACTPAGQVGREAVPLGSPIFDPGTMNFLSPWVATGQVRLDKGVYRQKLAFDSASELVVMLSQWQAFGPIQDQRVGVVILVTETGGTGTFYDLALLVGTSDGWFNSDLVHLGDRIAIHALELCHGKILVDITAHGSMDPRCCPTQRVQRHFAVQEGRLIASVE